MYFLYITNFLEIVAAVSATIYFKKYRWSNERYFLYFLWFTVVIEILGGILGDVFSVDTFRLYNFYMVASFLFYLYWYYLILRTKSLKIIILIFVSLFILVVLWDLIFHNKLGYQEYTFVTGALFTLTCTIFHFRQLLYSDEILVLKNKLSFWISTGLLLFNMGMIPLMLLSDYFDFVGNIYYIITIVFLNIILYGCYIIGFQWAKEKYNRF